MRPCELCGAEARSVLDLGSSPPTCFMADERRPETHYPLELLYCDRCSHGQLSLIPPRDEIFPANYPYSSGNSRALRENFAGLAQVPVAADDLVVDIGANDGTLLRQFSCRTVGVEPTRQAEKIDGPSYQSFFTEWLAWQIRAKHGPAKVVTACNVLAHVEDLPDVMRGIHALLDHDGILIAENHDLGSVVAGQWDTIYHEHLRFYSPNSFAVLLSRYGFRAKDWKKIPTHGGSFRVTAERGGGGVAPARDTYDFEALTQSAQDVRRLLRTSASGRAGIGATARATTLINYCGLDVEDIPFVCEVAGSDKIGKFIPGTRIPVVDESQLDQRPSILFSWHLAGSIVPNLRRRGYGASILAPLPTPRYL